MTVISEEKGGTTDVTSSATLPVKVSDGKEFRTRSRTAARSAPLSASGCTWILVPVLSADGATGARTAGPRGRVRLLYTP